MEEKYLPLEVSDENLDSYVHELLTLMSHDKLFEGNGVMVIPEAHGYIGKDRAIAAEKIELIDLMTVQVGRFRRNWVDKEAMARDEDPKRKVMDFAMDRILSMVNPEEREKARALICRIWKYFEENEIRDEEGNRKKHLQSYELTAKLVAEQKARGIEPLSRNEKTYLLDSLSSLKQGSTELYYVLSRLDYSMKSALGHAHPHSGRSREIAKFRGENLEAYSNSYQEIKKISEYIAAKAKEMGWK